MEGGREGGYGNTYIIVVEGVQPTPNYPLKQSAWKNLNVNFVAHTCKIYNKSSMLGQKRKPKRKFFSPIINFL